MHLSAGQDLARRALEAEQAGQFEIAWSSYDLAAQAFERLDFFVANQSRK
jgi:hypothetical protein